MLISRAFSMVGVVAAERQRCDVRLGTLAIYAVMQRREAAM